MVSFKKYVPSFTTTVQVAFIVTVLTAVGGLAWSSNWVRSHVLGRV